jgi:hypothetical protein
MLRKLGIISVLSLIVVALTASVALAQNPQLKQKSTPRAQDLGTTLQVSGTLVGLGAEGGTVEVIADATAEFACINPGAKGQKPPGLVETGVTVSGVAPTDPITRSGQTTFTVATLEPATPEGLCPPPQTAVLEDVEFTSFDLFVTTFSGERVFLGTFEV